MRKHKVKRYFRLRKNYFRATFWAMEGYLTTKEAAARLGVSTARIRQMIIEGVINGAEKFGRDNVVSEKEVKRLESLDRKAGRPAKVKNEKK